MDLTQARSVTAGRHAEERGEGVAEVARVSEAGLAGDRVDAAPRRRQEVPCGARARGAYVLAHRHAGAALERPRDVDGMQAEVAGERVEAEGAVEVLVEHCAQRREPRRQIGR